LSGLQHAGRGQAAWHGNFSLIWQVDTALR